MDFPVVEKLIQAILTNYDNQRVTVKGKKFKGQHAIHKEDKNKDVCQTSKKLQSDSIGLYPVG